MAMSFSRPDPASPAQVADASFSTGRRGYDQNEVRDFLRMVSAELGRLRERETFLERELHEAQNNPDLDGARLDDEALTRLLGEETARVLNAARESAHEIREKAEQSAARMLLEASDEVTRLREEAEIESSRRRSDAAADAEAELAMAKQQGREMVTEARAYRERVLSELARRRELAREQIEQLVHGRDRLMQAFERARLVAVDVVAEMQPLGEPDEYVDLTPSTGPVPVMVARQDARPADTVDTAAAPDADAAADEPGDTDDADVPASAIPRHEPSDDDLHLVDPAAADTDTEPETETALDDEAVDPTDADEVDDVAAADEAAAGTVDADADAEHDAVADVDAEQDAVADAEPADAADGADTIEESPDVEDAPTEGPDDAQGADGESDDGATDDDVVVDLFARLRADASPGDTDADDDSDAGDARAAALGEVDAADDASDSDSLDDTERSARDGSDVDGSDVDGSVSGDEGSGDTVFDLRDADLTPLIVSSARKLKRVLADEQNEVLDALRRSDPVRNLDELLPWKADHLDRYASVIADDLLLAANSGGALADPERTPKLPRAAGRQAVAEATDKLGQWLVQPLRDRLARCVSDGDGDNAAITKKVRAVYRECKTRQIDEQLDDVIRVAHGRGLLGALEPDTAVQWTPDPSHDVCADCDDNRLAGVVASGQPFPTGVLCTPAHPGCRCMLVPVAR